MHVYQILKRIMKWITFLKFKNINGLFISFQRYKRHEPEHSAAGRALVLYVVNPDLIFIIPYIPPSQLTMTPEQKAES